MPPTCHHLDRHPRVLAVISAWILCMLAGGCSAVQTSEFAEEIAIPEQPTLVREQLAIHSNFNLPPGHRLVEELTARRFDLGRDLSVGSDRRPEERQADGAPFRELDRVQFQGAGVRGDGGAHDELGSRTAAVGRWAAPRAAPRTASRYFRYRRGEFRYRRAEFRYRRGTFRCRQRSLRSPRGPCWGRGGIDAGIAVAGTVEVPPLVVQSRASHQASPSLSPGVNPGFWRLR